MYRVKHLYASWAFVNVVWLSSVQWPCGKVRKPSGFTTHALLVSLCHRSTSHVITVISSFGLLTLTVLDILSLWFNIVLRIKIPLSFVFWAYFLMTLSFDCLPGNLCRL